MPRGYWIAHVSVDDTEAYKPYVEGARPAFEAAGARFLARGGAFEEVEGGLGRSRHVLIEFPSLAAAQACWASEVYQAARAHRLPVSTATITLVEGLDDPTLVEGLDDPTLVEGLDDPTLVEGLDDPAVRAPAASGNVAPGYWTAHVRVDDPDAYGRYIAANAEPFARYGARFLARAGTAVEQEGAIGRDRHVLIAFPSYAAALDCWNSDAYAAARMHRIGAGEANITVIEGLPA